MAIKIPLIIVNGLISTAKAGDTLVTDLEPTVSVFVDNQGRVVTPDSKRASPELVFSVNGDICMGAASAT